MASNPYTTIHINTGPTISTTPPTSDVQGLKDAAKEALQTESSTSTSSPLHKPQTLVAAATLLPPEALAPKAKSSKTTSNAEDPVVTKVGPETVKSDREDEDENESETDTADDDGDGKKKRKTKEKKDGKLKLRDKDKHHKRDKKSKQHEDDFSPDDDDDDTSSSSSKEEDDTKVRLLGIAPNRLVPHFESCQSYSVLRWTR